MLSWLKKVRYKTLLLLLQLFRVKTVEFILQFLLFFDLMNLSPMNQL